MNFGLDQLASSYTATSGSFTVVGPSSWLGEMSIGGVVPPGTETGTLRDYSF